MPKRCKNILDITGSDKEINQLIHLLGGDGKSVPPFSFEKIVPLKNASSQDIKSVTDQWGTKWEIDEDEQTAVTIPGGIRFAFATAWAPPIGVIESLSMLFPELKVVLKAYEPGMRLAIEVTYRQGSVIKEKHFVTEEEFIDFGVQYFDDVSLLE